MDPVTQHRIDAVTARHQAANARFTELDDRLREAQFAYWDRPTPEHRAAVAAGLRATIGVLEELLGHELYASTLYAGVDPEWQATIDRGALATRSKLTLRYMEFGESGSFELTVDDLREPSEATN